jgi:hypothetical protein
MESRRARFRHFACSVETLGDAAIRARESLRDAAFPIDAIDPMDAADATAFSRPLLRQPAASDKLLAPETERLALGTDGYLP